MEGRRCGAMVYYFHEPNAKMRERRKVKHMAERGRSAGFVMSNEHRVKIQNSNILNALIEHVTGDREMSSTQVTAGIALLRKVMPDLASTTIEGGENPVSITFRIGGD
jgi:hypothetical protein